MGGIWLVKRSLGVGYGLGLSADGQGKVCSPRVELENTCMCIIDLFNISYVCSTFEQYQGYVSSPSLSLSPLQDNRNMEVDSKPCPTLVERANLLWWLLRGVHHACMYV